MQKIVTSRQIGQCVNARRKALELTQLELATRAGVSRAFVNRLEAGSATAVYPEKLLAVLNALGLSLCVIGPDDATENDGPCPNASERTTDLTGPSDATYDELFGIASARSTSDPALFVPRQNGGA